MKKTGLFLLALLSGTWAHANSKLTALTADTTAQASDLLYKVDSPSGSPQSRAITAGNFLSQLAILSTGTLQSGATFFVTSGTVQGNQNFYLLGTGGSSNSLVFASFVPLPRSGGVGPQTQDTLWYAQLNQDSSTGGVFSIVASTVVPSSSGIPPTSAQGQSIILQMSPLAGSSSAGSAAVKINGTNYFIVDTASITVPVNLVLNSLSPGVLHTVAGSSVTATRLVSLSTEVTGSLPAASIAAGSLGPLVLASSFPVSGVTAASYTNTNLTVTPQGIITAAASGSPAYAVEPATVTFKLNQGYSTTTGTFTALSPGVMHIIANSSAATTGLVSLSTEVTGSLPAASIAAGSLGPSVLASSFPVSGVTSGSYSSTNLTINAQGIVTAASNGNGGYNVEPATVTFKLNQGFSATTGTFTTLSPGVMHIVAASSAATTGLVSMSTETTGAFISSVNVSAALTVTANGANNTSITVSANSSSATLQGNTFNTGSNLVQLSGGLIPNSLIDGSSVTKQGVLNDIHNQNSLQSGATFFTSSGTAQNLNTGNLIVAATSNGVVFTINNATGTSVITANTTPAGLGNIFQVKDSTGRALFSFDGAGHMVIASTAPVLSSCGTSPSLSTNASDMAGTITVGGSASGCTLTFANTFGNKPTCLVSEQTGSVLNVFSYTTSTSALVISQTGIGGDLVDYACFGH